MTIQELQPTEFALFYSGYISKVPKNKALIDCFESALLSVPKFFNDIPKEKLDYSCDDYTDYLGGM